MHGGAARDDNEGGDAARGARLCLESNGYAWREPGRKDTEVRSEDKTRQRIEVPPPPRALNKMYKRVPIGSSMEPSHGRNCETVGDFRLDELP